MRWLFADPQNAKEMAYRQRTLGAIDRWWQAFGRAAPDIARVFSRQSEMDLPGWMAEHLGAVDPRLCWEYGPARNGQGHRLVITPEAHAELRPVVRTLLERAPKLPGWEFYPFRPPENCEQTLLAVEGRVGVKIQGAMLTAAIAPTGKIDVSFCFPPALRLSEEQQQNAAFVACETLFGEQALDAWIGAIDVIDPKNRDPQRRFLPLERGQETVAALMRSWVEQLPAQPYWQVPVDAEQSVWSNYRLGAADPADDYAERDDVWVGSTRWMPLIETVHRGLIFVSNCHSRHNEVFCYLKLDAEGVADESRVEFRAQFEDALTPALERAQCGGLVGSATGQRYSYIDLALANHQTALPLIRQVLGRLRAPQRSWLLFFDSDLRGEWVGAYPQTPPPPEREAPPAEDD